MILIKIPFRPYEEECDEQVRGAELSQWLKNSGAMLNKDYTWSVRKDLKQLHFYFNQLSDVYATALTLKEVDCVR